MPNKIGPDKQRSGSLRIVTAVYGAFLIVVALVILVFVDRSMILGGVIAALVSGALGIDACVSAARNKTAWVQRIGPLP